MFPCLLCFPPLKCFSPTAGHTVVETLCLRKDSGTDLTSCWVVLRFLLTGSPNCLLPCLFVSASTFTLRPALTPLLFGTCVVVSRFRDEARHVVVV